MGDNHRNFTLKSRQTTITGYGEMTQRPSIGGGDSYLSRGGKKEGNRSAPGKNEFPGSNAVRTSSRVGLRKL